MSYVIVGNVWGTSTRPRCAHGSWIDHYYWLSGSRRMVCSILGCGNYVTLGAHVRPINIGTSEEFIVPMCNSCNANHGWHMYLKLDVPLVYANTQKTGCYRRLVA
jgi:hypothetical protein